MWVEPISEHSLASSGESVLWKTVKESTNEYFRMQYRVDIKPVARKSSGISWRTIASSWGSRGNKNRSMAELPLAGSLKPNKNPSSCKYRIVLSSAPPQVVCVSDDEPSIRFSWEYIEKIMLPEALDALSPPPPPPPPSLGGGEESATTARGDVVDPHDDDDGDGDDNGDDDDDGEDGVEVRERMIRLLEQRVIAQLGYQRESVKCSHPDLPSPVPPSDDADRTTTFAKLFPNIASQEGVVAYYHCAMHKKMITYRGKCWLSEKNVCFMSKVGGRMVIPFADVAQVSLSRTHGDESNAIEKLLLPSAPATHVEIARHQSQRKFALSASSERTTQEMFQVCHELWSLALQDILAAWSSGIICTEEEAEMRLGAASPVVLRTEVVLDVGDDLRPIEGHGSVDDDDGGGGGDGGGGDGDGREEDEDVRDASLPAAQEGLLSGDGEVSPSPSTAGLCKSTLMDMARMKELRHLFRLPRDEELLESEPVQFVSSDDASCGTEQQQRYRGTLYVFSTFYCFSSSGPTIETHGGGGGGACADGDGDGDDGHRPKQVHEKRGRGSKSPRGEVHRSSTLSPSPAPSDISSGSSGSGGRSTTLSSFSGGDSASSWIRRKKSVVAGLTPSSSSTTSSSSSCFALKEDEMDGGTCFCVPLPLIIGVARSNPDPRSFQLITTRETLWFSWMDSTSPTRAQFIEEKVQRMWERCLLERNEDETSGGIAESVRRARLHTLRMRAGDRVRKRRGGTHWGGGIGSNSKHRTGGDVMREDVQNEGGGDGGKRVCEDDEVDGTHRHHRVVESGGVVESDCVDSFSSSTTTTIDDDSEFLEELDLLQSSPTWAKAAPGAMWYRDVQVLPEIMGEAEYPSPPAAYGAWERSAGERWSRYFALGGRGPAMRRVGGLLADTLRGGIPNELRGELWQVCSGACNHHMKHQGYYWFLLAAHAHEGSSSTKDIDKDVTRSLPNHPYYRTAVGTEALRRVLVAYSWHNPRVGYCQSMNKIAALLLLFMPEEHVFWVVAAICEQLVPGYYVREMVGCLVDQAVFRILVKQSFPALHRHFKALNVQIDVITLPWLLCLFTSTLPVESSLRVLDCFFHAGAVVLFRTGIALLDAAQPALLEAQDYLEVFPAIREAAAMTSDDLAQRIIAWSQTITSPRIAMLRAQARYKVIRKMEARARHRRVKMLHTHSGISEELLHRLYTIYQTHRVPGISGLYVDQASFEPVLACLIPQWSSMPEITRLTFQYLDTTGCGRVSLTKCVLGLAPILRRSLRGGALRALFEMHDERSLCALGRGQVYSVLQCLLPLLLQPSSSASNDAMEEAMEELDEFVLVVFEKAEATSLISHSQLLEVLCKENLFHRHFGIPVEHEEEEEKKEGVKGGEGENDENVYREPNDDGGDGDVDDVDGDVDDVDDGDDDDDDIKDDDLNDDVHSVATDDAMTSSPATQGDLWTISRVVRALDSMDEEEKNGRDDDVDKHSKDVDGVDDVDEDRSVLAGVGAQPSHTCSSPAIPPRGDLPPHSSPRNAGGSEDVELSFSGWPSTPQQVAEYKAYMRRRYEMQQSSSDVPSSISFE